MQRDDPLTPLSAILLAALLVGIAPSHALANMQPVPASEFRLERLTCESPVRLTRDCSAWQGATRPILLGGYRMMMAADNDGSTVLVSRLKLCPDHNDSAFVPASRRDVGNALRQLGETLQRQGIELRRTQPVRDGRAVTAWFLEFSGNAYDYLKQFTVLGSEYWMPARATRR
ncbi:MAG: hypothetical protein KDJ39_07875 [Gammaproteobacteria bacterium]|nr:hypothetical protein [Gammaproteobacteria bacterium]MCP5298764.1 hypothetical protein [Chromatiaceae bacterium]